MTDANKIFHVTTEPNDREAARQAADFARCRCGHCGTEYPAPRDECDWCPGVKPEQIAPRGEHLQLVTAVERETVPGLL
jgi:hypothetical protein